MTASIAEMIAPDDPPARIDSRLIGTPFSACGPLPKPHLRFVYSLPHQKALMQLDAKNNSNLSIEFREKEKSKLKEHSSGYFNYNSSSLLTVADHELILQNIPR